MNKSILFLIIFLPFFCFSYVMAIGKINTNYCQSKEERSKHISKVSTTKSGIKIEVDTTIHWYALEKENDSTYWNNVNYNIILIEFKVGVSMKSKVVLRFLKKMDLRDVLSKSRYPTKQNFFVFKVYNGNKNKLLRIIKEAKKVKSILYAEPEAIIKSKV